MSPTTTCSAALAFPTRFSRYSRHVLVHVPVSTFSVILCNILIHLDAVDGYLLNNESPLFLFLSGSEHDPGVTR